MNTTRRYDIDWLRVIAIFLLLVYHVAITFQPWGVMIGFITNKESWGSLWIPMTMLNVWRIPLLFFVSGMGMYFAMLSRTAKELVLERTRRILVPLLFGVLFIVPLTVYVWQRHYNMTFVFPMHPAHLWFLANIYAYVMLLTGLFYWMKKNENGRLVNGYKRLLATPLAPVLMAVFFIAEVLLLKPHPFELYAMTWHGFALGFIAFLFGFSVVFAGAPFWEMIRKWKWAFLVLAVGLFLSRAFYTGMNTALPLIAIESTSWIMAAVAFCSIYLNKPGQTLTYLSKAVLPVYIIHMIFIHFGSLLIFPLDLDVKLKFVLMLIFTIGSCFAVYELVIRRIKFLWPLFGMR